MKPHSISKKVQFGLLSACLSAPITAQYVALTPAISPPQTPPQEAAVVRGDRPAPELDQSVPYWTTAMGGGEWLYVGLGPGPEWRSAGLCAGAASLCALRE